MNIVSIDFVNMRLHDQAAINKRKLKKIEFERQVINRMSNNTSPLYHTFKFMYAKTLSSMFTKHLLTQNKYGLARFRKRCFATCEGPEPTYSKAYKKIVFNEEFKTSWNEDLPNITLAYETWGMLNRLHTNAVLLTTGLSASSHAASHADNPTPGWWQEFVGPGRALDTNKFFIICCNVLGSCFGSTGPSSTDPRTNKPYGLRFPFVSIQDMVRTQFMVLDTLNIHRLHAVVGSSMGGMQSLCAAAMYADRVNRLVTISAAAASHPMSIALRYAQRCALLADPSFNNGDYYDGPYPLAGMRLARALATVGYRSGPEWEARFGRRRTLDSGIGPKLTPEFEIEKYLDHQGKKWCELYDPNSMIILSKAMDHFTMEKKSPDGKLSLQYGLSPIQMPTLVMGSKSDTLFPIHQQKEIAEYLRNAGNQYVIYYELDTFYGHDTFLIDVNTVGAAIKGHLEHGIG